MKIRPMGIWRNLQLCGFFEMGTKMGTTLNLTPSEIAVGV